MASMPSSGGPTHQHRRDRGEIVGVVRDSVFALGLQVLNLKTRGGALLNDEAATHRAARWRSGPPSGACCRRSLSTGRGRGT